MIVVGHNLVSDLSVLVRGGYVLPLLEYFDTEVASRWLYPDQLDHTLEHLALRMSDIGQWRSTLGKLKPSDFAKMDDAQLALRCGGDAAAPVRLYQTLSKELDGRGLRPLWAQAMQALPILAEMGGRGMALNVKVLKNLDRREGAWLSRERRVLERVLGIENLDSHLQLSGALFAPPHNAVTLRRTTKGYSSDRVSLLWARHQARAAGHADLETLLTRLLEYSTRAKRYSTYYHPWSEAPGGRVRSFYSLGRAATGRLASSKYNLQNVPELVRQVVVPSPGYNCIVVGDMAQLEWRIAAHVSQDPTMLSWVRSGIDAHSVMAAQILGEPVPKTAEEFVRFKAQHHDMRQVAKRVNFATLYGATADTLSWHVFEDTDGAVWIPPRGADGIVMDAFVEQFEKTFTDYGVYCTDLWYDLAKHEEIVSSFGRRWLLPPTADGWRKAKNYMVQPDASDLTVGWMIRLAQALQQYRLKSRLIGEVHDSIVLEVTARELRQVVDLIRTLGEQPDTKAFGFELTVPLSVEVKAGETWGNLHEV